MTEPETIEAEAREITGQALEVAVPAPVNLFRTEEPTEIIRKASETATALREVLRSQNLLVRIGPRDHVRVEGWTLLGSMLGVFPVCEWTRQLPDGWEARVEAKTMSGAVVGAAEASCLRSEKTWSSRDDYALRSMAQTRATSKALRQPLGFVVSLAGFDPTPAEEMPREAAPEKRVEGPEPLAVPRSWAKVTEYVSAYDEGTHDLFFRYADSARRYLYPGSVDTAALAKEEKAELLQIVGKAAHRLREMVNPTEFPPPPDAMIMSAFASVMDGHHLSPTPVPEPDAPDPETFQ